MAEILYGKPVAAALNAATLQKAEALTATGRQPTLATLRVGDDGGTVSYEKGVASACGRAGVAHLPVILPTNCTQDELVQAVKRLAADKGVHGILVFSPLPRPLNYNEVRQLIPPAKDVDGITDASMARIYTGKGRGFTPCTAEAAMRILDFYNIDCTGKRVCVVGRSLVTGRPAAMLLLGKNATVTMCHTKTADLKTELKRAEIVVSCVGKPAVFNGSDLTPGQVCIDVGTSISPESGKIVGDFDFETVSAVAAAVTPVPGGVGSVTTAVLLCHTVAAAEDNL